MPSSDPSRPTATPGQAVIIRIALFTGVAVFGAVGWLVRSREPAPSAPAQMQVLSYVFLALVVSAVSIAAFMKRRQAATQEWAGRLTCGIIGWAACESTALCGGVYWLLTGQPGFYLVGGALLLGSLLLLAPRPDEPLT